VHGGMFGDTTADWVVVGTSQFSKGKYNPAHITAPVPDEVTSLGVVLVVTVTVAGCGVAWEHDTTPCTRTCDMVAHFPLDLRSTRYSLSMLMQVCIRLR
jgi:hypothetical protein